jgi:hypothetical protein
MGKTSPGEIGHLLVARILWKMICCFILKKRRANFSTTLWCIVMFWQKYCVVSEQKLPSKADRKMFNGDTASKDTHIKSVISVLRGCIK